MLYSPYWTYQSSGWEVRQIPMLQIRLEQLNVLAEAMARRDRESLATQFRNRFRDRLATYTPEGLNALVDEGITLGRRHGVMSNADLLRLLALLVRWGSNIETNPELPWARNILRRRGRTGIQKIEALEAYSNSIQRDVFS